MQASQKNSDDSLNGYQTKEFLKQNPMIIDVRPEGQFSTLYTAHESVSIPLDELMSDDGLKKLPMDKSAPILLY